jgi:hypothetical protein
MGPFVDKTDGNTPEASLTIGSGSVYVSKAGAALAAKNDATAATGTGTAQGFYTIVLDATDTNTLGSLRVYVHISADALPVWQDFQVVDAVVYDSLFAANATDYLQVDVRQVNSTSESAVQLGRNGLLSQSGTVDDTAFSPTTTEFEADDITEATTDHYVGRVVIFRTGAVQYQGSEITAYSLQSGRGHFTVNALTEAPANDVTFQII